MNGVERSDEDYSKNSLLMQDFGVEFALRALMKGLEDSSRTHIRDVQERFAERWASTHPRAVAVRRALLQSLQPATKIEELLKCVTSSRTTITNAKLEVSPFDKTLRDMLANWERRWPSESYDSTEVWERVSAIRSIGLQALSNIARQTSSIDRLIGQAKTDTFWHASRGLRKVGEANLSLEFFRKYSDMIE